MSIHVAFYLLCVRICNVVEWDCGTPIVKCCDNKKVQQVFH